MCSSREGIQRNSPPSHGDQASSCDEYSHVTIAGYESEKNSAKQSFHFSLSPSCVSRTSLRHQSLGFTVYAWTQVLYLWVASRGSHFSPSTQNHKLRPPSLPKVVLYSLVKHQSHVPSSLQALQTFRAFGSAFLQENDKGHAQSNVRQNCRQGERGLFQMATKDTVQWRQMQRDTCVESHARCDSCSECSEWPDEQWSCRHGQLCQLTTHAKWEPQVFIFKSSKTCDSSLLLSARGCPVLK